MFWGGLWPLHRLLHEALCLVELGPIGFGMEWQCHHQRSRMLDGVEQQVF